VQLEADPVLGLPHPHDNVRSRFRGETKEPAFPGFQVQNHTGLVVGEEGNGSDIDESIGLHGEFRDGMNFYQSVRGQSESRRHYVSVACPTIAQHDGGRRDCSGAHVALFVRVVVVFVFALQQGRQGHGPVDVVALKLEFVRFDLQQKLILVHRYEIRQLPVIPGIGDLVAVRIDRRKVIVVQAQQTGIARSPRSEFRDLKLIQGSFPTDQSIFVSLGHGRGRFESQVRSHGFLIGCGKVIFGFFHESL